jgi:hypothetical protein
MFGKGVSSRALTDALAVEAIRLQQLLNELADLRLRAAIACADARQITADFRVICAWRRAGPMVPISKGVMRRAFG